MSALGIRVVIDDAVLAMGSCGWGAVMADPEGNELRLQ